MLSSQLERASIGRVPWACIGLLLSIVVIECGLATTRGWFADRAAWQWQVKTDAIANGDLRGDVAVLGTSVLFHSFRAEDAQAVLGDRGKVVNLALNGLELHAQKQLLERYLDAGNTLRLLVLELRDLDVEREAWLRGPYWRFWARADEFLESGIQRNEPSLLVPFAANRLLTSFSFRRSLQRFLMESLGARRVFTEIRDRNRSIGQELVQAAGFSTGTFQHGLEEDEIPGEQDRAFRATPAGRYWLDGILRVCEERGIEIAFLRPPVPSFVARDRRNSGYDEGLRRFVEETRTSHPRLELELLAPADEDFVLDDFADDHHLSPGGADKLTARIAEWLARKLTPGDSRPRSRPDSG